MRLPNTAHTSRPWRIHELTRDFRLEDAWALPTPGGPDDFPRLVGLIVSGDPAHGASRAARALWAIRLKFGELLGWDDQGPDSQRPSLRDRLPADLRAGPSGPDGPDGRSLPFTSLYLTGNEWAAEIINRTVHGVLHLGWVPDQAAPDQAAPDQAAPDQAAPDQAAPDQAAPDQAGRYHGQLAVYAKPNGPLGTAYMAAITPFRHLIIYPSLTRQLARAWRARADSVPAASG